ncbi:MAG: protein kinase, partial [Thermoanaerobaculia bacterium]|nr:protein kinase [Thermoanaerobaculia bacterium]
MIGQRLGPYEITAKLGEGGMGEVYRATDTKLKRDVAIKVLPQGFTEDKERLARFEREAQVLAQLHHPNIASIFGLEESDGTKALVMELVEGPTLAERLESGSLPFNESLSVSLQIAHALEEAHEKGIVHRDLKPQNIKASIEGKVKVLDFGLAKAMDPAAGSAASAADLARSPTLMQSPTLTAAHGTQLGVILGTAAYMAPEQARGVAVDKRADIWAFGVVLFEMLTSRRLFEGELVTDVLADVLRREIDFDALPPSTPPAIRRLLRRCLERNPKNRLHDIADARLVIEDVAAGRFDEAVASAASSQPPTPLRRGRLVLLATALVALGVVGGRLVSPPVPETSAASAEGLRPSFRQLTKMPGGENGPTLAPDGETLVYVKHDGGDLDLFSQRVDGTTAIALTVGCDQDDFDPAFSPDGRRIAFRSECDGGGIFVMGATGEARRRVSDFGFAPAWSPDGNELAVVTERLEGPTSRQSTSQLWAVRVDSGERRRLSEHDAMGPTWSPDGRRIAFWGLKGDTFQRDLWSVSADGSQSGVEAAVTILDDPPLDWAPVYSRDGRWLYFSSSRGGTYNLWRFALDPATGEPAGAPEPVTAPSSSTGLFALSADGRRIVYVDVNMRTEIVRAPYDSSRRALAAAPVPVFSGSFELREQNLSPAGDWIVFTNEDPPQQLHLVRPDGTGYRQLTSDDERHRQADFSPDGAWIVFQTTRGGAGLAAIR